MSIKNLAILPLFAQQQRQLPSLLNQHYYNIPTGRMQLSIKQQWKPVCHFSLYEVL